MEVKNRLLNFDDMVIYQNDDWFCFSLDSVLLANFVTVGLRDKMVMDMACGNAPIPMLLSKRTRAKIYGVELQKEIFDLAVKSVKENGLEEQVCLINKSVNDVYLEMESDLFDVITCNPPYFRVDENSNVNDNMIKRIARHEVMLSLEDVIVASRKLLKNGGKLALVHRPDRFMEILMLLKKYNLEPKRVQFVYPKRDAESNILLIEAVKNGKAGLKVLPPLVVHNDDGSYSDVVRKMYGGDVDVANEL